MRMDAQIILRKQYEERNLKKNIIRRSSTRKILVRNIQKSTKRTKFY